MTAAHPHRIFVWLDRAFWLIWLGFPVLIWLLVSEIRSAPEQLAEINPEAWATLNSDTSRAFDKPKSGRIAVKVINHLGDEVMKVFKVN